MAVTADGDISNQATEIKMAVHMRFVELCMTLTADDDRYFQSEDRSNKRFV